MDKVKKALAKLTAKERTVVQKILRQLSTGNHIGLHIQKLKGYQDIFRVRKGRVRIIYRQTNGSVYILIIERRSENTYRNF